MERTARSQFVFAWPVPNEGFEWITPEEDEPIVPTAEVKALGVKLSGVVLRESECESEAAARKYNPMEIPDLHRRLAAVEPTHREILQFANEYGRLGRYAVRVDRPALDPLLEVPIGGPYWAEDFAVWRRVIETLRQQIELWDVLRSRDVEELEKRLRGESGDQLKSPLLVPWWQDHEQKVYRLGNFDPWEAEFKHVAPEMVRTFLVQQINAALTRQASPYLVPNVPGQFAIQPHSLHAAIYTLFALEVAGRAPAMKPCRQCGRLYYPTRRDNLYCSAKCRDAWYYARRPKRRKTEEPPPTDEAPVDDLPF